MCKLSNKLKLCSCKTKDIEKLQHYWKLQTHNGLPSYIVGEAMLPANIGKLSDRYNINVLKTMLNNENCFDIEMMHREGDRLELHFSYVEIENHMPFNGHFLAYTFIYKNGKWKNTDFDPFGENLTTFQAGKIMRPFA